ncbi:hypothetical protein [Streptomyces deccanensis]|uniref:hypothetical protein n=1 Tax=Streptomyces deccanensis TaxID=424188 RepID=UPI001EFB8D2C|nr:hypothetical protein [Streptomyces deccanensis]ULR48435.1 hypothetical protein L3078_03590 [Streptomyces deccanensis]
MVRVLGQAGRGGLGRETVSKSSDGLPADPPVFVIADAARSPPHTLRPVLRRDARG